MRRSSPGLLLTAQQLKKVERDVRYVPAAAGAISSILCRSVRSTVHDDAMNIMSSWDYDMTRMGLTCGIELGAAPRTRRARSAITVGSKNTIQSRADDEKGRFDALRSILERRLRFIVSDEFKDAKKTDEKEQQKREREGAAVNKKTKKTAASGGQRTLSGFAKPSLLSDELCEFMGVGTGASMARTEVTRKINEYIKKNNLQDAADKRHILPDANLKKILNLTCEDKLTYFNLQKYMKHHFTKETV